MDEYNSAILYACDHMGDAGLMLDLANLARPGAPFDYTDPGITCFPEVPRRNPAIRDALIGAALTNTSGPSRLDQIAWVAGVLAGVGDEGAQDGLARLLTQEVALAKAAEAAKTGESAPRNVVAELSTALRTVTEARKAASPGTIPVLRAIGADGAVSESVRSDAAAALAAVQ